MSGYLYLFFQIWVWIVLSFIFGWVARWFFCCRRKDEVEAEINLSQSEGKSNNEAMPLVATAAPTETVDQSWKPHGFTSPPDKIDDLKRIKGVGSVIEETLNNLGVYQFEQVSKWDDNNVSWVENFLAFPGRIQREDWVNQSKTLGDGGTTEFAKRVDKGDINYS